MLDVSRQPNLTWLHYSMIALNPCNTSTLYTLCILDVVDIKPMGWLVTEKERLDIRPLVGMQMIILIWNDKLYIFRTLHQAFLYKGVIKGWMTPPWGLSFPVLITNEGPNFSEMSLLAVQHNWSPTAKLESLSWRNLISYFPCFACFAYLACFSHGKGQSYF